MRVCMWIHMHVTYTCNRGVCVCVCVCECVYIYVYVNLAALNFVFSLSRSLSLERLLTSAPLLAPINPGDQVITQSISIYIYDTWPLAHIQSEHSGHKSRIRGWQEFVIILHVSERKGDCVLDNKYRMTKYTSISFSHALSLLTREEERVHVEKLDNIQIHFSLALSFSLSFFLTLSLFLRILWYHVYV